ncbi:ATP-grasp peptide maturase system methyltransferase [Nocardiopsis exhalans]|uniref:Protein-L-isoaspartate O-methyltransferase n=1 Tax=Nocardiopsis exhalans TaxID=163604 RepID=A0ABY5D6R1_9ACTN|nr:ATP-grasp peptide maturase system methyltransferase [Nocardiopsis exhalans]USY20056.1 ATP-grasp peptide maturase system methyltransferase [Nocardiopsis exhalans]
MIEPTTRADELRTQLVQSLTDQGYLPDPHWRKAFEAVPRHVFVPGFYLRSEEEPTDSAGVPVWEPVTERTDPQRWLSAAYSDQTLITQFDGREPDWANPEVRHGGVFSSSATLPSLVATMWDDAQIADGHSVLEIGTGTGYSTAVLCERVGSGNVISMEVDGDRLAQAHRALSECGHTPSLVEADGLFGWQPGSPFDRVVAACSMRHIPRALFNQTRAGGKILVTLSGWLGGSARVLLTVDGQGRGAGPLLAGTISFMPARLHAPPGFGDPRQWARMVEAAPARPAVSAPERISGASVESFLPRFLAQCAAPNAQSVILEESTLLVDVVSGSVALIEPAQGGGWQVLQTGPVRLWDRIESALETYDRAGRPDQESFRVRADESGQWLEHSEMPAFELP